MQVELAHGGRGPSSSSDHRGGSGSGSGGRGGGGRYGISHHSEYRGAMICINVHVHNLCTYVYGSDCLVCSYCSWASTIFFMARLEGKCSFYKLKTHNIPQSPVLSCSHSSNLGGTMMI